MPNFRLALPFSPVSLAGGIAGTLLVVYMALIAVVMSYAALTVEFSQQERNDEATVAALEATYLASVSALGTTDYKSLGYAQPVAQVFVTATPATALR